MPGFAIDQIVDEIWSVKFISWTHYNQHNYTPVMSQLLFNHLPNSPLVILQLLFNHWTNPKLTEFLRVELVQVVLPQPIVGLNSHLVPGTRVFLQFKLVMVPALDNSCILKMVLVPLPVLDNFCILKLVLIPVLNNFRILKLALLLVLNKICILKLVMVPAVNIFCILNLVQVPVLNNFRILKPVLVPILIFFLNSQTGTGNYFDFFRILKLVLVPILKNSCILQQFDTGTSNSLNCNW